MQEYDQESSAGKSPLTILGMYEQVIEYSIGVFLDLSSGDRSPDLRRN